MIKGFSKLSVKEKIDCLSNKIKNSNLNSILEATKIRDENLYGTIEEFSENVIGNFPFPFSLAPNVKIDGKDFIVPLVTEESSVVAAIAKSAGFWYTRGGFHTTVISTVKNGHIHFLWKESKELLHSKINSWKKELLSSVDNINAKMKKRGGGLLTIELIDKTKELPYYFQLEAGFDTKDAMGANFMNTCLEKIAETLYQKVENDKDMKTSEFDIIMSILSNYSPHSIVEAYAECPVSELKDQKNNMHAEVFASKFKTATNIANTDVNRAVTHNKGIYNGIDAIALATGNDWRAIEANGHAYASKGGSYKALTDVTVENRTFRHKIEIPLQVGVVGGITSLHPLAKLSLEILENPTAEDLMRIIACIGLASNFAAIKALIVSGIQKGHMKMHLTNILKLLGATEPEINKARDWFSNKTVSHAAVEDFLKNIR